MKVMVLTSSLAGGGTERATTHLVRAWSACGHEVTVATLSDETSDFYRLPNTVRRLAFGLLKKSNGPFTGFFLNLRRIRKIRRAAVQLRPDFLLGMMDSNAVLAILATIGLRIQVVACERTYPPMTELSKAWKFLRKCLYPLAACIVVQTQAGSCWITEHIRVRRTKVIPNGIALPLEDGSPIKDTSEFLATSDKLILGVGRLGREKDHALLIDACAPLLMQNPDWKLAIIGEGPLRIALENRIREAGLHGRAILPGRVGNVADWYNRAAIFILTSRFEGFPNALLEAMAHGCACISLNVETGPAELIQNSVNGLLVDGRAAPDLRSAVQHLIRESSIRHSLGISARSVQEKFSISAVAHQWLDLFSDLQRQTQNHGSNIAPFRSS